MRGKVEKVITYMRYKKAVCIVMIFIITVSLNSINTYCSDKTETERYTSIVSNALRSFAIKDDNSLWGWGENGGLLGDGTTSYRLYPVKIMDSVRYISIDRDNTAAIKLDGSLWIWGSNYNGAIGDGTNIEKHFPTKIMDSVSTVSINSGTSFAIKTDGTLWAWGSNRHQGCLGDGTTLDKYEPVKIMESVSYILNRGTYIMAIKTDGCLWSWGLNLVGCLGDGTEEDRITPVKVLDSVKSIISCGAYSTLAIRNDNSLWAWGLIYDGIYNNGVIPEINLHTGRYDVIRASPVKIMDSVVSGSKNIVIKSDGSLWTWGRKFLWDNEGEDRPYPIKVMEDVRYVEENRGVYTAIKTDNSLWAWGSNYSGELGDGTTINRTDPVKIMDSVEQVAESIDLKTDGSLWTWGDNDTGKIGNGTINERDRYGNIINNTNIMTPIKIMDNVRVGSVKNNKVNNEITVVINGREIEFDERPIIREDRVLVPLRKIFEELGAAVTWEDSTQIISAIKGDIDIKMKIGENIINRNGQIITLDVPAQIINDRTYVPTRAVAECFGARVEWDGENNRVMISM